MRKLFVTPSPPTSSREWNSTEYHRLSRPQLSWGKKVVARLQLRGDETLLDAGCGTGRLTAELLHALPNGQVVALDVSQNMLRSAREYLQPQFGERAQFVAADLPLIPFEKAFDGVVSTAAFHWVLDHDRLFCNLYGALRPGGWLQAQCGGGPNIARLRERIAALAASPPFAQHLADFPSPWLFQNAGGAADTLRRAGFVEIETGLEPAATVMESRRQYEEFVRTMIVRAHIERLPDPSLRDQYLSQLADLAAGDDPPFLLDYWRLNLAGKRPG
jgi:trans-aconitate 2-methyltransferase